MLRDRVQQMVMRDHADDQAIGILDDSGHPKKGKHTACVAPQYCGRTGKIDNCVVSVHLSYATFDTRFRVMLDSTLFLPQHWTDDAARRKRAGIPDDVVYRPKYEIVLEQLDRARSNGVHFAWITADIWYSEKPKFLAGLEQRGLRYVVEIPRNLQGWTYNPGSDPQRRPSSVENLCHFSRNMLRQPWTCFHIKNTEKGPMVWEVKACAFWLRRDEEVRGPYWLIYVRNVLDPTEHKYFLSDAAPGTPLSVILHVGFGRWPLERCLEDKKSELGLSHFEVRNYRSIHRHFYLTQVSHLFAAHRQFGFGGKNPEITICQVRAAANVLIDVLSLSRHDRDDRLERATQRFARIQQKNAQARRSHTKTRNAKLKRLNIDVGELRSCIPR